MFRMKKVRFWDVTPGTPEETAHPPNQQTNINRPEAVGRLPIYQRRHFHGISHNNHKHIDDTSKYEIRAIDDQIQAAINAGKPEEIADHLDALLDKTFFGVPASRNWFDQLNAAFERLDKCDIGAATDEIDNYARGFAKEVVKLERRGGTSAECKQREGTIAKQVRNYLKHYRTDKGQFQQNLFSSLMVDKTSKEQRCSAQKMALETFAGAFPVLAKAHSVDVVPLLKKLNTVLPNLEHHDIVARNAQRRGLEVLGQAFEHLTPDEKVEVLADSMDSVASLSKDFSRRFMKGTAWKILGSAAACLEAASASVSIPIGVTQAVLAGAGVATATGLALTPFSATTAILVLAAYLRIPKQAVGTALYMFSRELENLRKDWDKVSPESKEKLTTAFRNMRDGIWDIRDLKSTTANRIYYDEFLDPSNFGTNSAARELLKKAKHHLISPFTSRLKSVLPSPTHMPYMDGYNKATIDQKKLCELLNSYHSEARSAGVPDAVLPEKLLENLLAHTEDSEYANAFGILTTCFERVREMPEYENPVTRPKFLKQIMEITKRLATGDKDFVRRFVGVAQLADQNCHNNGRQILKRLWDAVRADKAEKGEDGLNDELALLREGMAFFRQELLERVKFQVLGKGFNVETGIAVDIALGKLLRLPDPIEGMDNFYFGRPTGEQLENIKNIVLDNARDRDKFIDFLSEWDPVTEKIKNSGTFQADCDEKNEKKDAFDEAQNIYFASAQIAADKEAFDHAGHEYQHADAAAKAMLIREKIGEMLDAHWDALTEEDDLSPAELIEASTFGPPGGVDQDLLDEFKAALEQVERVDEGPGGATFETEELMALQYTAPPDPSSSHSPINREDIPAPFKIVEKGAGGDCLFYALGEKREDIEAVRGQIARAILLRPDNELARNRNAHHVVAALTQSPGETQDRVAGLTYGRHAIPNSVYAKLVAIPGIYAGDDEVSLYSSLLVHRDKTFVVVDQDGTLFRVKNDERERLRYTDENKAQVLRETLSEADVALYKTPNHWQQIALPAKSLEQDFLNSTFSDEVRAILEMLKKEDEEDSDLTELQDDTEITDEGVTLDADNTAAIHAVAGGSAADPYNLQRFVTAQGKTVAGGTVYDVARAELKAGVKIGHWMWYVFPLVQGITSSTTSRQYGISSVHEAQAYLADPVLGPRLRDCAKLVLHWLGRGRKLEVILGKTDAWKFQASMTLFAEATKDNPTGPDKVFHDCVAIHNRNAKTDTRLRGWAP